jgi:hypothetical protein
MEQISPNDTVQPQPDREADLDLWVELCLRAMEDDDRDLFRAYLMGAESIGLPQASVLDRLKVELPGHPFLQESAPPTLVPPSVSPPSPEGEPPV